MGENFNENTSKNIEEKIDESPAAKIALVNAINNAFIVNSSLDLLFKRFSKFTSDPTSNETVNAAFSGSNGNSETIVIDENETEKNNKRKNKNEWIKWRKKQ